MIGNVFLIKLNLHIKIMQIKISVIKNKFDNKPINHVCTYSELLTMLTTFITIAKDDAPAFIAGHFKNDRRITENLESRTLITLDVDKFDGTLDNFIGTIKELDKYRYIAYSTASHTFDKPRVRIVLFLDQEIETEIYSQLAKHFVSTLSKELQDALDIEASTTANKPFILPIFPHPEYIHWYNENAGISVDLKAFGGTNETITDNVEDNSLLLTIKNKPLAFEGDAKKTIIAWLKKYPANQTDHDAWLRVGMALHHQFEGGIDGLDLWERWSKKDDRVRENGEAYYLKRIENIKTRYNSIRADTVNPTTFATIIAKVKENEKLEKKEITNKLRSKPLCRSLWVDTKGKNLNPKFTENNFEVLLKYYKIELKYNIIKKEIETYIDGKKVINTNNAIHGIKLLCSLNDLPTNLVNDTVNYFAWENSYNSWQMWVDSKKWDGIDRLQDFYNTIQVIPEHECVKEIYLWKFLLQLIHITCLNEDLRPKVAKLVLTLQGATNTGKTTWTSKLIDDTMYDHLMLGHTLNLHDETNVKKVLEHVIVELGELGATYKKSDIDAIKNFISAPENAINVKFLARAEKNRRTTVFVSTVNEFSFLQDSTGNSRFMCLSVILCDIFHTIDMQQLYAQVLDYARKNPNESYFLNKEEAKLQANINETMEVMSPFEEKLHDIFELESNQRENIMNATNILLTIGYNQQFIKKAHTNEISKILDKMQFVRHNKSPRGWFMPPKRIKDYDF